MSHTSLIFALTLPQLNIKFLRKNYKISIYKTKYYEPLFFVYFLS